MYAYDDVLASLLTDIVFVHWCVCVGFVFPHTFLLRPSLDPDDSHHYSFMESNPFVLPTDEEIFKLREQERKAKRDRRMMIKNKKVHEKTTFSSRMSRTTAEGNFKLLLATDQDAEQGIASQGTRLGKKDVGATGVASGSGAAEGVAGESLGLQPTEHRRRDKENMTDYIAKKREIFLVQMSLDTKRAEIRKLEERALQREEALRKSEQMLEEDADRFDDFLRENDEKVQEAIRKAEIEGKAKQDKVVEIKRLNAAIATIRSELNKYEEQLEDCHQYKRFLDHLTPQEWFKEVEERRARERRERGEQFEAAVADYNAQVEAYEAALARQQKLESEAEDGKGSSDNGEEKEDEDREYDVASGVNVGDAEGVESEKDASDELAGGSTDDGAKKVETSEPGPPPKHPGTPPVRPPEPVEETPMYFTSSQQLLDVLAQLEEQNLFLIQNCQETEEALEELKQKHRDTKQRMGQEVDGLQVQIEQLQTQISTEEEKARMLRGKAGEHSSGGRGSHETTLEDLSAKVADVYVRCGFDHDPSITTLQMLTNIEAKLEEYLAIVDIMPEETVEQMERAKEKERRHRAREEKLEQQRREQEKRVQRALERAQAPVHKKTGKPVMTRSQPLSRKKKNADAGPKKTDEEEELQAFLERD